MKYSFSDSILELKMEDSLKARISIMENIQKEFGHDIQEIKGQLARLTKLIKGHTRIMLKNIRGSPSFPLQPPLPSFIHQRHPSHESRIPVRGNVPLKVYHPNRQSHTPTPAIILVFGKVSQLVDPVNSSGNNLEKPRRNRDKKRLDPIPATYTELLPKLLAEQLIALSCAFLFSHHFPNHTILMSIVTIILRTRGIRQRIVFLSNRKYKHLLRLGG